jgi:hypothetical protein
MMWEAILDILGGCYDEDKGSFANPLQFDVPEG